MTDLPDPWDVLRGSRRGREESVQQLLTMLIVEGTYPRWNTRSQPSPRGIEFLTALYGASFDAVPPGVDVFVDEFDLPRRHNDDVAGSPDWAVIWPDRLWMIELKTEKSSHRPEQLPRYLAQGVHHHPGIPVDLTYLTGPLDKPAPPLLDGQRYRHVTWDDVLPILRQTWTTDDPRAASYVDAVEQILSGIPDSWPMWRAERIDAPVPARAATILDDDLLEVMNLTAEDGLQRAVDVEVGSPETLDELRVRMREFVAAAPAGSPLKRITPWRWVEASSGGQALTEAGRRVGMEVRVSAARS